MELLRENLFGLIVASLMVGAILLGAMARYDYQSNDVEIVAAEIIGHNHVSYEGSPRHHFIVKLSNGEQVRVYDNGEYPTSYRGPADVAIGKGVQSGKVIYKFASGGR